MGKFPASGELLRARKGIRLFDQINAPFPTGIINLYTAYTPQYSLAEYLRNGDVASGKKLVWTGHALYAAGESGQAAL